MMKRIFHVVVTLVLLVGCGGGSTTGGGSGNDEPSLVGVYVGTASITLLGPGTTKLEDELEIQFVIAANGPVTVSKPDASPYAEGPLTGNSFVIIANASALNEPGFLDCAGSFTLNGMVSGNTITGTMSSGTMFCNNFPFTLTGSFNATS